MRKLLLSALGLLCSVLGFAQQMDLPVTFDVAGVDYGVIGFEGAEASSIEADPTDASNIVVKVIKSAAAQPWAGTTITNAAGDGLATAIPFATGSTQLSLRVWSPDAGIQVRLKVEDHTNPTISVETEATTTSAGAWETLIFNFANQANGTAAINFANSYDKASVFFNFGTNGATAGEKTYYFDDLEFYSGGTPSTYNVTFKVDMQNHSGFTIPEVNGTFNNWCGNCNAMSDANADGIWEITLPIAPGTYEYKFANDNWAGQENLTSGSACTVTNNGFTNRSLVVNADVSLPVVCWESCAACDVPVVYHNVTFQVDMQNQTGFTTPEVNGTFNNWCGNCNAMSDVNADGIWEISLDLPEGIYEYKFANDNWAGQENLSSGSSCTVTNNGFTNRALNLTSDLVLPVVCWGSCVGCNTIVLQQMNLPVTFEDALVEYGVIGFEGAEASTIEADPTDATNTVVKVIKSAAAQPWAGTTVTNSNGDGLANAIPFTATETQMTVRVWSPDAGIQVRLKVEDHTNPTISVETEATTTSAGAWETLTFDFANQASGTAALNIANTYDKATIFFNFGTNGATAGEKTYYFDDVAFGNGSVQTDFNVTFQVDMQNVTGFTTPEVNGTFNNWCGGCAPMSDTNSDGVWELTIPLAAGTYEFKYANDNWAGQENLAPGGSCVLTTGAFTNRVITVSEDMVMPVVCWGSCSSCDNPSGPFNVTFKVDMRDVTASYTTPEVNGTFNNWCGGCAPMTDTDGDNIWELTIPLPADTIEYKFAYDSWAGQESMTAGSSCTKTTDNFTNRTFIVSENITLPAVCWGSCELCPVGINDIAEATKLSVYPNPAQGLLNVALNHVVTSDMNVRVMDASGRVVMALQLNPVQKFALETKSLTNGVYFIQVNSNEFTFNQPFIVQN